MVIVTNLYDHTTYSLDESDSSINEFLRFRFPEVANYRTLEENIEALDRTQTYSVYTDKERKPLVEEPMEKIEYDHAKFQNGDPVPNHDSPSFIEKQARHIYNQLPRPIAMGLMHLLDASNIPMNHHSYFSIAINKPFDYVKSKPFQNYLNTKMGISGHDAGRFLQRMREATDHIKNYAKNSVYDPVADTFHQSSSLDQFFKKHDENDSFLRPMTGRAAESLISIGHKYEHAYDKDTGTVEDMVGSEAKFELLIEAAKFVSGRSEVPLDRIRDAFVQFEGDLEAGALWAVGLKDTPQNRDALKAVAKMADFTKFENGVEAPKSILPSDDCSKETAEEVKNAFNNGSVKAIKLNGKHSKGTLIARDPRTMHVWLIKPGSGATSPAAGVSEEAASQSAREAAFSHVARDWKLGNITVKAEMLNVDGNQWAALAMLPYNYQNADKWKTTDYGFLIRTMEKYRMEGFLHRAAVLDYILGNPDRHAQNVMVSKEGQMTLIDHGSAFAGDSFNPDADTKSFVPFYLRYNTREFNKMNYGQKLHIMPRLPMVLWDDFKKWFLQIDPDKMRHTLEVFGINPLPSLNRYNVVKQTVMSESPEFPVDVRLNRLWLST